MSLTSIKYVPVWELFQPKKLLEICGVLFDLITKYVCSIMGFIQTKEVARQARSPVGFHYQICSMMGFIPTKAVAREVLCPVGFDY
jgi:hypothetical protein